jgi:multiple sugar transport system permease protein
MLNRPTRTQTILLYTGLYVLVMLFIFPYLIMVTTALKPRTEIFVWPPHLFPQNWQWRNFVEIFQRVPLAGYLTNSLTTALGATLMALVCGVPAAYVLARIYFPGRRQFLLLVLVTQMFSPIVIILGLYRMMSTYHLLDTHWSLILTYAALNQAFTIWLLTGYFASIPQEIEEAAFIDGCSRWQMFWRVVMPLSRPGVAATVIFVFIQAWNEFMLAFTFLSTEAKKTLTVGIYAFVGQFDVQWHYLLAASIVATAPVLLLFIASEKQLIKGLTAGAIK